MQITATNPVHPVTPADRHTTSAQAQAATKNAAEQAATAPKVFTPAPPLRPNVQDYVDIDRTLIALRTP